MTQPSRPGRPLSTPGGRGRTLTITLRPATRATIEAAAARQGRSLSQVAGQWIDEAAAGDRIEALEALVADLRAQLATRRNAP